MLKIILIVALVVALAIVVVLVLAATRPKNFRISRSILIKAKADKIFALIDDFHAWSRWSPYENRDPAMSRTYGPTASGKGAVYSWAGSDKTVGAGRMEITESAPPHTVLIKVDFSRPFEAHNIAQFTLEPEGDQVRTTWAMFGPAPFMNRLMGLFMNFDKTVGKDFESGLANLKVLAES